MNNNKSQSPATGEIVNDNEVDGQEETNTTALLVPQYLLPALTNDESHSSWSKKRIVATAVTMIVLTGLVALYIHGSNVVGVI